MRNNLLVTILFLFSSSIIISQDLRIKNLQIESKNNGTVIQLDSNRKVNLENVTAWYSSEWFYMTIYDANADSLSLANYRNDSLKNIEVSNSDESTQIAVQLFSDIESFEINTPKRKTLQFFLRNNQSIAKNSISIEDRGFSIKIAKKFKIVAKALLRKATASASPCGCHYLNMFETAASR